MRLLLDTAVFLFATESPARLSKRAASVLGDPENTLELSTISIAEIALKCAIGKLRLSPEAVREGIEHMGARILPYNTDHGFQLFSLPLHDRDPFDRQIIAQAITEQIAVITPDENFRSYAGVKVIW